MEVEGLEKRELPRNHEHEDTTPTGHEISVPPLIVITAGRQHENLILWATRIGGYASTANKTALTDYTRLIPGWAVSK